MSKEPPKIAGEALIRVAIIATALAGIATIVSRNQKIPANIAPVKTVLSPDARAGHNMTGMSDGEAAQGGNERHNTNASTQLDLATAKLEIAGNLLPQQPVKMTIDIKDLQGKSIAKFDTFQEKLMHLIVVSDDLSQFNHLHPTYQGNGQFTIEANFPKSGNYSIFSDYKPAGWAEQVSVMKAEIPGRVTPAPSPNLELSKTIDRTEASLQIQPEKVTAGQMVQLNFNLVDTSTKKPIADLQPYLGERGHLVIVRQANEITKANYIHAHAMPNAGNGQIQFMTTFPKPGKYKLWGQFNRNGKIVIADFWVNVV